jgi:endonuclease YncB( thermonuclease family)
VQRLLRLALLSLLAGAVAVTAAVSFGSTEKTLVGKVTAVPYGDTLVVKVGKAKPVRVHVLGIRAPAAGDCHGGVATAVASSLALNQRVTISGTLTKKGVVVIPTSGTFVTLPNGEDLGRLLLARGAAQIDLWSERTTREQEYADVQRESVRRLDGMWRECSADLEVSISGPDQGLPGQLLSYPVVVKNVGPLTASEVELRLRPGNYSEFVHRVTTTDGTCTPSSWAATCKLNALAPGAAETVTVILRAVNFGALSARAEVNLLGCVAASCGKAPLLDPSLDSNHAATVTILPGGGYERKCDPSYPAACIPVPPPDLDCEDFRPLRNFPVRHDVPDADDHHLDGNHDGVGCQEEDY